jgi:hypothetical protein
MPEFPESSGNLRLLAKRAGHFGVCVQDKEAKKTQRKKEN